MLLDLNDDELQTLMELLKYFLLGMNVLLFLTAALVFFSSSPSASSLDAASSTPVRSKRALLVTAHPDDESMFFLPLLHSLQPQQPDANAATWETHLLCLSRGNFDGLGAIREKELLNCVEFLGLSSTNVQVLEDPKLQDGMQTQWDVAHVASVVLAYMDKHAIDAVFTFDDYGVSGHANHIATHFGVKRALKQQQERCNVAPDAGTKAASPVRGWALESTGLLRKYVGVLDTALSFWQSGGRNEGQSDRQFVFLGRPLWNYRAMALHRSQFVWYRRLFVVFSRYTFINTFRPLLPSVSANAELSMDQKKEQ
ncbi:hypothetical protein BBJ28_00017541 [Nothophytophthora sp. Chile5]|nr:hypothetical protein BBJ28_00017541 [Nothophytophthora sp. Chile5]